LQAIAIIISLIQEKGNCYRIIEQLIFNLIRILDCLNKLKHQVLSVAALCVVNFPVFIASHYISKMALSRPIYNLLGIYFEQLFNHPLRTKSITSCVIATSANYASQKVGGSKKINKDTLVAYGIYGLIFGGSLPHFFYKYVEEFLKNAGKAKQMYLFLIERLVYAPMSQAVSLYFLSRFEGNSHEFAFKNLCKLYWPLLTTNWKYLSLLVFINVKFVPPMLRVLVGNLIGFFWVIFVANKRRKAAAEAAVAAAASQS